MGNLQETVEVNAFIFQESGNIGVDKSHSWWKLLYSTITTEVPAKCKIGEQSLRLLGKCVDQKAKSCLKEISPEMTAAYFAALLKCVCKALGCSRSLPHSAPPSTSTCLHSSAQKQNLSTFWNWGPSSGYNLILQQQNPQLLIKGMLTSSIMHFLFFFFLGHKLIHKIFRPARELL